MEDRNASAIVLLEKHEIKNLIEFIDLNFFRHICEDEEIGDMGYIVSMSEVYKKLKYALEDAVKFAELDFDKLPNEDVVDISDREDACNV